MSTSILYHAFGVRGYVYEATEYQQGRIAFRIRHNHKRFRCPECKSRRVVRRGCVEREFRQVIVAQDVTQQENDVKQLGPLLKKCEQQAGARPGEVLADAGYWSEENAQLASAETELFIATTKDWKQRQALRDVPPPRGRIPNGMSARERMERKLLTKRGREAYKQRGSTIEPVFGQMVMRGLVRFKLRGLKKVRAEWSLRCTAHNLLKLWRSGWRARQVVDDEAAVVRPS